jgi:hypothetical protein
VRSTFALLTLLLIAALGLVAPSGCAACRVDVHGGQGLHVVFDHPHPAAPVETDGLAAVASDRTAVHAAHAVSGGEPVLADQVMSRTAALAGPERAVDRLTILQDSQPVSLVSRPLDPPPRAA